MTTIIPLGRIEPPVWTGKRGKPVGPEGLAMLALALGEAIAFREYANPEFLRRSLAALARRHGIRRRLAEIARSDPGYAVTFQHPHGGGVWAYAHHRDAANREANACAKTYADDLDMPVRVDVIWLSTGQVLDTRYAGDGSGNTLPPFGIVDAQP